MGLGFGFVVFGFPFGLFLNMIWVHDVCLRVGCLVKGFGCLLFRVWGLLYDCLAFRMYNLKKSHAHFRTVAN